MSVMIAVAMVASYGAGAGITLALIDGAKGLTRGEPAALLAMLAWPAVLPGVIVYRGAMYAMAPRMPKARAIKRRVRKVPL